MRCFYPSTTEKIIHKGKSGNIYKLDGIEKGISLYNKLKTIKQFDVKNIKVSSNKETQAIINLIEKVHSKNILKAYKTGKPSRLANYSGVMWQPNLYNFVLESAKIAKKASIEALKTGKSLAIVGGGHHAERKTPLGFCTVNTMAIAALIASEKNKKVAVIDLDVHYSNGCFDILKNHQKTNVYSLWNQKLDKWKTFESKNNIWHKKVENTKQYFSNLDEMLTNVKNFKPDLIVYHLGLDVLETDRMGGIKGMDTKDIMRRERLIQNFIKKNDLPFCIFMGGAYINWTLGSVKAQQQRNKLTKLQTRILIGYEKL